MRRIVSAISFLIWFTLALEPARGEVAGHPDASRNTDPNPVPGWYNVGELNGASGVYLGGGWVLTVAHLGTPTNFILDGNTYLADQPVTRLHDPSDPSSPADLQIFHVAGVPESLPSLKVASMSPSQGTSYTAVGFGSAGVGALQYYDASWNTTDEADASDGGYALGDRYNEHWAAGQTVNVGADGFADPSGDTLAYVNVGAGNTIDFFSQFYAGLSDFQANPLLAESEIGGGDSGGAVFDQYGNLIGISEGIQNLDGQPDDIAAFGDMSAYVDLAEYRDQILADTPEPSGVAILTIGAVMALARRHRARVGE